MDNFQIIFGCIHVISAVLCVPVLFRLFYILVSRKEYRNSTCYRLIAQEILLCCMSGCSYFVYGLAMILDSELAGILLCAHAITRNSFISIACLNLALALKIPHFVVQCLQAVAWSFIVIAVSIELAGATGIKLLDNGAIVYEDVSLLVTLIFYRTMAVLLFTSLPLSFFIYLAITAFLIHRRKQRHLNVRKAFADRNVALQAGIIFIIHCLSITSYGFLQRFIVAVPWTKIPYALISDLDYMILPIGIYLGYNAKLRRQVLPVPRRSVAPHTQSSTTRF